MLTLLTHNTEPCLDIYHSLADSMKPIDPIGTPPCPGQTSDPTVANVWSIPSPPRSYRARGKPSTPVVSVPYSARGKPPPRSMLPSGGVFTHNR